MQPLAPQPALIDRAYERLVEAIAEGTLDPGPRIRQEELGRALGDAASAERAARGHADRAGAETARRLSKPSLSTKGNRNAADGSTASAIR
jgi:hypothetical protein